MATRSGTLAVLSAAALLMLAPTTRAEDPLSDNVNKVFVGLASVALIGGITYLLVRDPALHGRSNAGPLARVGCYRLDRASDTFIDESDGKHYQLMMGMHRAKSGQRYALTGWDQPDRNGQRLFKVKRTGDSLGACTAEVAPAPDSPHPG